MNTRDVEIMVQSRYGEPWRHYHNWHHVMCMLEEFENVRDLSDCPEAVVWAIVFHDAVYEPTASNNEERSAELAQHMLRDLLPETTVSEIARLILLTKTHEPTSDDIDGCIICDCDLVTLSGDWEDFQKVGDAIRREYSFVPEDVFLFNRREFMKNFLKRPSIFRTGYFYDKYEERAQDNLHHNIAILS